MTLSSMYKAVTRPDHYPMSDEMLRREIAAAYRQLRRNVIDNVVANYIRTGFIWDAYDGDTGEGFNNHPFTGWSALVVNILSENC